MPIMLVTFPETPRVNAQMRADFILSLLSHRCFTKSRAAGKARQGIITAVGKIGDDGVMRLAALDHELLAIAVDKPEYEVHELGDDGKPKPIRWEDGYQVTALGVEIYMPILDAVIDAKEETAEAPKAAPTPEPSPTNGAPAAGALVVPETVAFDMPKAAVSS